jgi:hypothetical protein
MDRNNKMEMKKMVYTILALSIFFHACNNQKKDTMQTDLVGDWLSSDGALISLNKDSSFTGKSLPAEYFTFFTSQKDVQFKKIDGNGKWRMDQAEGFRIVRLEFRKINNEDINGNYSVLIGGSGALENKPPMYLFLWKDEPGGDRYEFIKK